MKLSDLKLRIAAYVNRDASSFVSNGVDNLLEAINDARRSAQLRYDFNALKVMGFIQVPVGGIDWTTGATTTVGGTVSLPLKRINEVWSYTTSGGVSSKADRVWFENNVSDKVATSTPWVFARGMKLYPGGSSGAVSLMVEGTMWLADLTDDALSDFFLDKGATWLLYQSVQNLNLYLKEDARVSIADAVVRRAWDDLVAWDGNLGLTTDAITLE